MKKEPLFRVVRRETIRPAQNLMIRLLSIIVGLLICALLIHWITKLNPIAVYSSMIRGAFGSTSRTWVTLKDACLLLCISVSLAPCFRMRFWNTGAEGQILMGGLVSAALMINAGDKLPNGILLILMAVCAIITGGIWGYIPAYFKAKYRTNETLFTLMMNYIALQLVEFFVDIWDQKQSHSVGIINSNTRSGWLPAVFGQQYFLLLVIAVVLAAGMYLYLNYSKHGYEIAVVGESENTARYAGIPVAQVTKRTMFLSGGLAGLAGFLEVSGVSHTISSLTAGGRGFTAIIVAWLAKFNTIIMSLFTLLLSFLSRGANQIASDFNFNKYGSNIVIGVLLFCIISGDFFVNYRLIFRKGKETR